MLTRENIASEMGIFQTGGIRIGAWGGDGEDF